MNSRIGVSPWIFLVMLAMHVAGVRAQVPEPLDQPNLSIAGYVLAVAKQPDGGIILGGKFTSVNGVARSNLARLLPDGTLDPDWNPSPNSYTVQALATDDEGQVYVAGEFSQIGGQTRNGLARLSAGGTGLADANWNPSPPSGFGLIYTIALSKNGYLYVTNSTVLVRFATDATGSLDITWNPTIGGSVYSILPVTDGNIYVGGHSLQNNGAGCLARISESGAGAIDTSWQGDGTLLGCSSVSAIATDGNAFFVAGVFHAMGQDHFSLAKILPQGTGSLDSTWTVGMPNNISGFVNSMAYDGHGSIYAGGTFNSICDGVACDARAGLAKLSTASPGTVDAIWNPAVTQPGYYWKSVVVSANGTGLIVTGGNTPLVGGTMLLGTQTRVGVAVLPIQEGPIFQDGFESPGP